MIHPSQAERLASACAKVVGSARVSRATSDRHSYARDQWPRVLIGMRDGTGAPFPPDVVAWPTTTAEVAALVRVARELGVPIVPYAAGSGVCGGAAPIYGGLVIDTKPMDRILALDARNATVRVQAGMNGERFERELNQRGFTLGHFPSSIYCSTVGGWLAARGAGQMSTKYGKIEDMTLGLEVVTGRGDIVRTGVDGRAAAGPDWTQIFIGSEGTLGVLTEGTLRLRKSPELRILRGFELPTVDAGMEAIRAVMQRGLRPAVVRLYDPFDSFLAMRHRAEAAAAAAGEEGAGYVPAPPPAKGLAGRLARSLASARQRVQDTLLAGALARPRILNPVLDSLVPKLARKGCLLIVGCEGAARRTEVEARLTFAELERAGGRDLGEGPGLNWLKKRYAVSYRQSTLFAAGAFADTMEVASTWERLPDLYESVRAAIGRHAMVMAHFSHAYPEGCSIYFTFVAHAPDRARMERVYDAIWSDGLSAAARAGGTISHHHGVGLSKGAFMAEEHRESMAILRSLKSVLDPDGVMNPGKLGLAAPPRLTDVARAS